MAILNNSRHETFAHSLARGATIETAFREAGYSPNSGNASRLNGNERVIARVAELRALIQNMRNLSTHRAVLTAEWVTEQLIGVVVAAKSKEKFDSAGANKALHLLGPAIGHVRGAERDRETRRVRRPNHCREARPHHEHRLATGVIPRQRGWPAWLWQLPHGARAKRRWTRMTVTADH